MNLPYMYDEAPYGIVITRGRQLVLANYRPFHDLCMPIIPSPSPCPDGTSFAPWLVTYL